MQHIKSLFSRELSGYFETPVGYVFMAVFLLLAGIFTFYLGQFYERGQADLEPFFVWHPWLYLFLVPAISMRLWSEERRSGTIELLTTLPIPIWQLVVAKFLAAWAFIGISLLLTFPIWATVSYLGDPDHGVILTGYIGSMLMAGGYLAIGSCLSAVTKNQVVAFVLSVAVCFLFTVAAFPLVLDFFEGWVPQFLLDVISSFGFTSHYDEIAKGVVSLRNIIYFTTLIALWLGLNSLIVHTKRI